MAPTKMFDKYYNIDKDELKADRKPLIKNKLGRSFETARDQIKDQLITLDEKITNKRVELANTGSVNCIKDLTILTIDKEDNETILEKIEAERAMFL